MQAPASTRTVSLLAYLALFGVAACGAPAPAPSAPAPAVSPPAPVAPWPRFTEVAAWPALPATPFPSQGHDGERAWARVRVNPEARAGYEALVQDSVLPDGSVVALFHEDEKATRGAVYVMQKAAGRWQFLLLDALGHPRTTANTARCASCHAGGVADQLFGLPRPRPVPASPVPAGSAE